MTITYFLLMLAFVLALLATVKLPEPPRLSYGWAAIALFILVQLLHGV